MEQTFVRHVHAAPHEHIHVHRAGNRRHPTGLGGGLVAALGPVGAVIAAGFAVWGLFELLAFVLGLVVILLKGLCVLLVMFFAFRLLTGK